MTFSPALAFERFVDALGLPHFRGREFTPLWTRERNGVRNDVPPADRWGRIVPTLVVLQELRGQIGPITLLSTYRSPAYNAAVAGEARSQHLEFRAIDFTAAEGTPRQWASALRALRGRTFTRPDSRERFTFRGGIGRYDGQRFVHVDTRGTDADWTG